MFSHYNISLTLLFATIIGSFIYAMVTSFSFGAIITIGLAGYVGYPWGFMHGRERQKTEDEKAA
jgi:hypothetical protein